MSEIQEKLKELIEHTMIPEVESYIYDLHKLLEAGTQTDDDMEAIKDMESFLVELQNVLLVVEEDKGTQEEYQQIYDNIMRNLKDHEH